MLAVGNMPDVRKPSEIGSALRHINTVIDPSFYNDNFEDKMKVAEGQLNKAIERSQKAKNAAEVRWARTRKLNEISDNNLTNTSIFLPEPKITDKIKDVWNKSPIVGFIWENVGTFREFCSTTNKIVTEDIPNFVEDFVPIVKKGFGQIYRIFGSIINGTY